MDERRQSPRARSYIGGHIVFNNGASSTECLVRNLSGDGALLHFSGTVLVPDAFEVAFAKTHSRQGARIVWRNPKAVGVSFDHPA